MKKTCLLALAFLSALACSRKEAVDLLLIKGHIHLLDSAFSRTEALAIREGKVVDTGRTAALLTRYRAQETHDLQGAWVYPGWHDAHAHFVGYAEGLQKVNLVGTQSYAAVLERVKNFAAQNPRAFIEGRGWDQNDWPEARFPHKAALDSLFPETPVLLRRIDGHAALANQAALDYAGLRVDTEIAGGKLLQEGGALTGILIDKAVDEVRFPPLSREEKIRAWQAAEDTLMRYGLTAVTDAGLPVSDILLLDSLLEAGLLRLRYNLMVSDDGESLAFFLQKGKINKPRLRVHSAKFYLDGALGSRGALLCSPYADDPDNYGLQLITRDYFRAWADTLAAAGWQMCVHGIGDSANRLAVQVFQAALKGAQDHRWRIEHAQIVQPSDQQAMVAAGIIPSIQPTHATSDMLWAPKRLGSERMAYAYPAQDYRQLGARLPLGTDFPVEAVNPLYTLRAALFRKDEAGRYFQQPGANQALFFPDALRGMTVWPAFAAFAEEDWGQLSPGYPADMVVYPVDLASLSAAQLDTLLPQAAFLAGEVLWQSP